MLRNTLCMLGGASNGAIVEPKDRKRHTRDKRERMLAAVGYQCHYCRSFIKDISEMRIDHKTPLSRGGSDGPENLAVTCVRCDYIKGNATEAEFRARGLGKERKRPFGAGKGMPKTMRFLRIQMRNMREGSRTRDILTRALAGEHVRIADYPVYINPRQRYDRLPGKLRRMARDYDFLRFENGVVWKCK